ncbi:TPA: AAA family ATPase [Streptococcus suis]
MTEELNNKFTKPRKPRHRKQKFKDNVPETALKIDTISTVQSKSDTRTKETVEIVLVEPLVLSPNEEKKTPYLDQYTEDITSKIAKRIEDFQVFGRDKEVKKTIVSLLRDTKNSPILIGEAGVGKTAIVDGLVVRILRNEVPKFLQGVRVRSLELASITSVTDGEDMIAKFKAIIEELKQYKDSELLFIDEVHTIVGTGGDGSMLDVGNVIKPPLARGEIQVIAATTLDEYQKSIETDPALERRFQPVPIDEPTREQAKSIIKGIGPRFESSKLLKISEEAYEAAVDLAIRYIPERYLPDKAIDLIDTACAVASLEGKKEVGVEDIALTIQELKGIPVTSILKNDYEQFQDFEEELKKRVKGQDHAVEAVAKAVYRSKEGLNKPNKPIGSFLFLGPTGVGKTELAKATAELLFDDENAMIRIDCSEYSAKGDKEKLIGKNEVGSKGILTDKVKNKPYSVVLFDELDKGNKDIYDIMLQILDDGFVTTGLGRKIDFKNTIIIGTTNMGADEIRSTYESKGNFSNLDEYEHKSFMSRIYTELKTLFREEWLNRWGEMVVFNMLTGDIIEDIVDYQMEREVKRLASQDIEFTYDNREEFFDYLKAKGTSVKNGARPLERLIDSQITGVLSKALFQSKRGGRPYKVIGYVRGKRPDGETERKDYRYLEFEVVPK